MFEKNKFHNKTQWLLNAYDLDKKEMRTFAMRDVHRWITAEYE